MARNITMTRFEAEEVVELIESNSTDKRLIEFSDALCEEFGMMTAEQQKQTAIRNAYAQDVKIANSKES